MIIWVLGMTFIALIAGGIVAKWVHEAWRSRRSAPVLTLANRRHIDEEYEEIIKRKPSPAGLDHGTPEWYRREAFEDFP
ncbi:MAG: hypothetical protein E6Q76_07355 [Rhizobium sp.]|nr:MAG: hypothetical protein E6Q76_07355 [Rhizobium sp.]